MKILASLVRSLTMSRLLALALAPAFLVLAVDSAISHFAGVPMVEVAQLVPVVFGALAFLLLLAFAIPRVKPAALRLAMRVVGLLGVGVGFAGVGYHAKALLQQFEGETLSLDLLEQALAVAPPMLAPAAFIGIGGLVWMLASPNLVIELRSSAAETFEAPPAPLASRGAGQHPAPATSDARNTAQGAFR